MYTRLRSCPWLIACCPMLLTVFAESGAAKTLCVNVSGSNSCYGTIQAAVTAASDYDVIAVASGTYKEDVVIGKPLTLTGAGPGATVINANGLANGIFVDGFDHPGLKEVTIAGFSVKNALYEGVLVVSTADVTIRNNHILNNDQIGPVFGSGAACKGQPAFETDESGDCGGGLHLMGTLNAVVSNNTLTGNGDGILLSDETAESRANVIINNHVTDNALECGIVLASHPPVGSSAPNFATHHGVDNNTVSENFVSRNGVKTGGAGVGLFSDGEGPGRVAANLVLRNELTDNGIPGISLHSHAGPAVGAPADDMDRNMFIGNFISGNGADTADTATPGRAGININSGGGGSPIAGTVISQNVIEDEEVDIAINTPAPVEIHLNDLLSGGVGVANVCALDNAACTGTIDATQNYWGCAAGPGGSACSTPSGANVVITPWLSATSVLQFSLPQ